MSDSARNLMEIYDDIELCYKVLGLTFSDPPEQVDKVCKGLVEKYTRETHDSDPEIRGKARANLDQVHDLYERITNSLIYRDYAREYEKYRQMKAAAAAEKDHKGKKAPEMIRCPYCSKPIAAKLRVCIYCHGKILTPFEMMLKKLFSKRNLIVLTVLIVMSGIVGFMLLNPSFVRNLGR